MKHWRSLLVGLLFAVAITSAAWAQTVATASASEVPGAASSASTSTAVVTSGGVGSGAAASAAPAADSGQPPTPTSGTATGTSTTPGAEPAAGTPAAAQKVDGGTYVVRLHDLEQRIDELKEQIRRSHTRLSLLSDTLLSSGTGGARASIVFENHLTDAFRIEQVMVVLDGAVQANKVDDGSALSALDAIPIYSGTITPGDHVVQVMIKLRGHGYGVFSYAQGYRFEIRDQHSFTLTEGKSMDLKVIAFEKGGVTTPFEERPALRYLENLQSSFKGSAPSETGASQASTSATVKQTGGASGAVGGQ
jgi:hypothetical protein